MNQHCPLQDSSACQHHERKGVCQACQFDFDTLDPDEGMFKLRRGNAENVFAQHQLLAAAPAIPPKLQTKGGRIFRYEFENAEDGSFCIGPDMIEIPAGRYLRGSPASEHGRDRSESPQVAVNVNAFQIGVAPITVGQWNQYLINNKDVARGGKGFWGWLDGHDLKIRAAQTDDHAVVNISWNDAQGYIAWINALVGVELGTYRSGSF